MTDKITEAIRTHDYQETPEINKSVEYGVKQNPSSYAEASKAAKQLNISTDIAERQPDEVKRAAKERDIISKIRGTNYLKKAMANPDFAAVAHDDVDGLVKTEASIKAIRGPEVSFSSISEGLMKSLPQGLELARQGIRMQWADLIGSERMYKDALRKYEAAQTDVIISQPEFESSTAQGIYSGATSFVRQTPGLAASIITRNPAPMLAGMGQMTEAEAYGKYRARGGTKLEALTGGMLEGAVEVGTELMPMKFLVDKFGKTGLGDFLTGILAREVPGEQIATIVQDAVDTAIANPDKTWGEYFSERPDAAYQTLLATLTNSGIMGTIHYGASRFSGGVYNADKAIEDKQALDNTVKAVSEVQLRNTAPEVFEQFLDEQLGADNNVFISPEDAEVFFQSNPEIFDKLPEEVSEAIKDSIGLGADVVIPKSQYLTYFPEYHDQLADVLRNDQDGFTAKEADEFVKEGQQVFEKEAEKMLVEQEKQSEFNLSAQKVRQDIKSQILKTGRFKEDVADQYAALHEAFAKTVAQKTGKMPYEAYFEMGPDIKGAPIAGEKLDQDQRTKQRQQPVLKKEDEVWVYKEGEEGEREAFKGLIIDPGKEESIVSINDQWETIPNAQLDLVDEGKLFQSAFHGSPYQFDKFTLDHIGEGEGAQAYGWGLYFADRKAVAEFYREQLQPRPEINNWSFGSIRLIQKGEYQDYSPRDSSAQQQAKALLSEDLFINEQNIIDAYIDNDLDGAKKVMLSVVDDRIESAKNEQPDLVAYFNVYKKRIKENLTFDVEVEKGQVYEVDIPDDAELLDSDKPLTKQPKKIKEIIKKEGLWKSFRQHQQDFSTLMQSRADKGEGFYSYITFLADEATKNRTGPIWDLIKDDPDRLNYDLSHIASMYLNSIGIPGLKYKAGQIAQIKDAGTNYVIFNEEAIKVLATYYQKERGFYQPDQNIIGLLEDADLSTFLHETGHFFLESISRMPEFQEEMDSTLKWMMLDRETWDAMSLEDKREYHEQFARGFEAYLLEGKSPSLELRSVFQRFRDWLINIYKSLRNLNVQLTPEIRQVFDRLLATDEQIREAEAARAYDSLFESIEESGMTEKQWTEYQRLNIERREEAREELQTRSLKDMKWMSNAKAKALRDIQRDVKAKRADIRKQVSDDVSRETVYQAIRFLRRGETVQDDGSVIVADTHRLDIDTLSEMFPYGEDIDIPDWRALGHGKYGMLQKEGLDPDEVAHNLKYSSADLMIRDILDAPDQKEYIEALTDQRMLETYGDISSPEAMAHAADEAIHNDVHTRFLHTELKILSKGQKDKNILARAAKQYAEQAIDKKKIRDIKAAQYLAAQTRAGNNALKALGKGDRESALDHKRAQVLNNHFFRAANNAEKYVEKKLRYLKKFAKEGTRKNIDQEYLEQIDDLLGSFDIKAVSLKEIDKRQSLQEFIQQQEENGFQPIIDPVLVETAKRQHYKNMPLEQFRGLVETIEHIDHLGRLKNKLLTAKDKRDFAQRIEEANRSIELLANRTVKERATPNDVFGKLGLWARQTIAMHRKFASIIREMDGNKDGGIMWNLLLRTMNESGDNEIEMHAQATERLGELFSKLDIRSGAGNLYARSYTIPNTDISLTDEQRIMVAMNWGNEGNRQRLLDGGVPGKVKLTEMEAHEILNTLTKSEWDFVQGVWDFLEEYRTQVGEQEKRLTGKTPEWVEPSSIETKYGTYRGGYFPAKYDVHLSERASELEASTDLRMAMKGAFNAAATRSGYAKERAQKVEGRHLLLSFDTISQHVSEVTHRLAWQDWVTDANRVLRALTPKIKEHYGNELLQEMKKSVKDIAADGATEKNAWMASLNYLRVGTTIVGMGYRITTAIIQPTGFAQSVFRVGKGWMAVGLKEYLKSPLKLSQTINEKSKLMRDRDRTMQREINEVLTKIRGNNQLNLVKANAFLFISKVQRTVDLPTWWGAYEKALSQLEYETAVSQEQREEIESRAIGMADQAVIDSQSGGQLKDLAAIQRGNAFQKLWTNFYSYFSATYNLNVEAFRRTDFKSPKSIGAFAGDLALLNIVPVLMTVAIKEAFKNDCDGDMECITDKVKEEQLSYIMGLSPITRELTEGVKPLFGLKSYGYQGPPGLRAFSDFYKFGQQASQGEFDEAFRKSALNLTGELTHLPLGQVNTIIDGLMAIENGEVKGGRTVLAPLVGPPRE